MKDIIDKISTLCNDCCKDDNNWILLEKIGCLERYRCKKCGEELEGHVDYMLFPESRPVLCDVFVNWSREHSVVEQINCLKKIVPNIKQISNADLLQIARKYDRWLLGEMYVSEAKEIIKLSEEQGAAFQISFVEKVDMDGGR